MFRLHLHFAGNQAENRQPKTDSGLQTEVKRRLRKKGTAEYRVQKHIHPMHCVTIITVSDTDLAANFIDVQAPHQNSTKHLAFLFSQSSIPYMVLYT